MAQNITRKLRILILCHETLVPPDSIDGLTEKEISPWKVEYDVKKNLIEIGHEVRVLGVYGDILVIRDTIQEYKPHIVFNLLEDFHGYSLFGQHIVSYLELLQQSYTGCNPRGLTLARDKALTKKILSYHRIHVPKFAVFPMNRKVKRPKNLQFPLLVKSLVEEGSLGIAQCSVVQNDEKLTERVAFIHERTGTQAIAEEFIEGRELYVSMMGISQVKCLPPMELTMNKLPEGAHLIATDKVKWDYKYQAKVGVKIGAPKDLSTEQLSDLEKISKRVYRALGLSGYARLDYRLKEDGTFYLIEANPNPSLATDDAFAGSAKSSGVTYKELLSKIISMGLNYSPQKEPPIG